MYHVCTNEIKQEQKLQLDKNGEKRNYLVGYTARLSVSSLSGRFNQHFKAIFLPDPCFLNVEKKQNNHTYNQV